MNRIIFSRLDLPLDCRFDQSLDILNYFWSSGKPFPSEWRWIVFSEHCPVNTMMVLPSKEYTPMNIIQWTLSTKYHPLDSSNASTANAGVQALAGTEQIRHSKVYNVNCLERTRAIKAGHLDNSLFVDLSMRLADSISPIPFELDNQRLWPTISFFSEALHKINGGGLSNHFKFQLLQNFFSI